MHERERITNMLLGRPVDRLPWATRLDIWHTSRVRSGTLPAELAGLDLMDIYRRVGMGRQRYANLLSSRLRGVELTVEFEGELIRRESDPIMSFPNPLALAVADRPGVTKITLRTPAGDAAIHYQTNESLIRGGAVPYLMKHVLENDDDFRVVKWIQEHVELLPDFTVFEESERQVGDEGFTIGMIERVPLQRILLEYMGEERAFYWMVDDPAGFDWLHDALAEQCRRGVEIALGSSSLVIEFPDNFDGMITSPRLFRKYCIPFMQEIADRVHAAGRLLASHMDGNMRPLVSLVPESGVDVAESFSPAPLSQCTFEEAWDAWDGKVLMWGAIPSPIFEDHVPEAEFRAWVATMLERVGPAGRIVLGIGDQAMGPSLIERVAMVGEML